jgi:pyruvate formate lyase activating enzyme
MGVRRALYYERLEEKRVKCHLCPFNCTIKEGKRGVCGVRENRRGELYTLIYGLASSVVPDPIEKKPLFHFFPGSSAFSMGTVGCNLNCQFCQNFSISRARPNGLTREVGVDEAVSMAKYYDCRSIAWTYNEPTIWFEYTLDCAKAAKAKGLATIYVTNGYINEEPLEEISPFLDAMNIDVKAFDPQFYRKYTHSRLEPVLKTVVLAKRLGIHIELTYLVIPDLNDDMGEILEFSRWVAKEVGRETPVHFSRFYPYYHMQDRHPTPISTLTEAYRRAREILDFVYLGNLPPGEYENTYCPNCGSLLVGRNGFYVSKIDLEGDRCPRCGVRVPIIP